MGGPGRNLDENVSRDLCSWAARQKIGHGPCHWVVPTAPVGGEYVRAASRQLHSYPKRNSIIFNKNNLPNFFINALNLPSTSN